MPTHASAAKRVRQTARRQAVNRARLSTIRTAVRAVEEALNANDAKAAAAAIKQAEPALARGVSKGVLKKETASRKISRLVARVKKLQKK